MNKKIVLAVFIIAMATIVYASGYITGYGPKNNDPPELPELPKVETMQSTVTDTPGLDQDEMYLEEGDQNIARLKLTSDCYGGIGGTENNPPQGAIIDDSLTKYYGKTTAKGNGETYIYISGWWFNTTQMMKLPPESIMYGVSPCAITSGSEENRGDGEDDGDVEPPIAPIPEMSTIALVSTGILALFIIARKYRT